MANSLLSGFEIKAVNRLQGWKVLEIGSEILLVSIEHCNCCNSKMEPLVSLINSDASQKIRLGCCPSCGFVSYIDRPSQKWIIDFYSSTWDRGATTETLHLKPPPKDPSKLLLLARKLSLQTKDAICEVGSGYGRALAELKEAGFTNLIGVENSRHRAEIGSRERGIRILSDGFESKEVQAELAKRGPYRLIFSSHVIEHVFNPREIVEKAAQLQKEDDYLFLSMPNFVGESAMGVTMFLPHLNSFTLESAQQLLARSGYQLIDSSLTTDKGVNIVGRKSNNINIPVYSGRDYLSAAVAKFTAEMALNKKYLPWPRRLWWQKKDAEASGQSGILDYLFIPRSSRIVTVANLKKRLTVSPIEIQTGSRVKLFYK